MTGKLLSAMPPESLVLVYGALSGSACNGISPLGLIFERKRVEGFWLSEWIKKSGFFRTLKAFKFIQSLVQNDEFKTKIRENVSFDRWSTALMDYQHQMTAGKVILKP